MNNDEVTLEDLHFGHLDKCQLIFEDKIRGKRIDPEKGISLDHWTGQAVIHFDDGQFAVLEIDTDYEDQRITVRTGRPFAMDLKYMDLITQEEWNTYRADKESHDGTTAKERRRKQYKRLKAEFGDE